MAWIESHQELRNHPKTKKAARLLKINEAQVIGHLHFLWWWAIDHAPDGDLSDYDFEEIIDAAGWTGKQDWITAMLECGKTDAPGFLEHTTDGNLVIHDWWQYAGKLITKREQNAERVRNYRERNAHVTRTQPVGTPLNSTVQNSTLQDSTEEQITIVVSAAWKAFESVRGINLTKKDSDTIAELVEMYSDEAVEQAINYCNTNKKTNFLSLAYIIKMLNVWQSEGTLGQHTGATSGNGNKPPTPDKYRMVEVAGPDGKPMMKREALP